MGEHEIAKAMLDNVAEAAALVKAAENGAVEAPPASTETPAATNETA